VPEISERTLRDQVDRHLAAYRWAAASRPIAVFVNVGGSSINLGSCETARLPPGILRRVPGCPAEREGLVHRFAAAGVPVIHLLNVRRLAKEHGLGVVAPPPGTPSAYGRGILSAGQTSPVRPRCPNGDAACVDAG
jgi:poly-gamma-glutamate system protein